MNVLIQIPDTAVPKKQSFMSLDLHFIDGTVCEASGCGFMVVDDADVDMLEKKSETDHWLKCTECKNFEASDNYCRMLQINFLPDEFGCNKGEKK